MSPKRPTLSDYELGERQYEECGRSEDSIRSESYVPASADKPVDSRFRYVSYFRMGVLVLTLMIPYGCASSSEAVPAAPAVPQAAAVRIPEIIDKDELFREIGADYEGFNPVKKSFVLCRRTPGITKMPFEVTIDALRKLYEELGIPKENIDPDKITAKSVSTGDFHCVNVTFSE